jgi:hypothetical protein
MNTGAQRKEDLDGALPKWLSKCRYSGGAESSHYGETFNQSAPISFFF